MSELHENNPRMAKCDLPHSPSRFVAAVMLGWLLATTPCIKAFAENNASIDLSASSNVAPSTLQADYTATRLANIETLDELLPSNLFTVEAIIFKRLDTRSTLLASADLASADNAGQESAPPDITFLDSREPLLRLVNGSLSKVILDLSPDTPREENRAWMHTELPLTPAGTPECVADPAAAYDKPLSMQESLEKFTTRLQPEDFADSYLSQDQATFPHVETLSAPVTPPELSPELPPQNVTTITPTPYLELIEELTYFDVLREHQEYRQKTLQDLRLIDSVRRLGRNGDYEILGHLAWQQRVPERGQPQPIYINLNDGQLQGELAITLGRYLHTSARLWFKPDTTVAGPSQYAQMIQSRRMRSATLHYFDHPLFGMIVRIDKVEYPSTLTDTFLAFKAALAIEN